MSTIWTQQEELLPDFPHLEGDREVDVLVIGGGLAGVLCALQLRRAGVDCLLVEAEKVCCGVTRGTTAKITVQHGLIYHQLLQKKGKELAQDYLQANLRALEEYRRLCSDTDCDFEEKDSFVYSLGGRGALAEERVALERLGCPVRWVEQPGLPLKTAGAVCVPHQAQFHPLKFVRSILPELEVREHTRVYDVEENTAVTQWGKIRAKTVVFCTHFPFLDRRGCFFMKMYQHRSYTLALARAQLPKGMYVDCQQDGLSFRSAGKLLLLGGGDHRTGSRGGGWQELRRVARQYYPDSREVAHWAAQDCITLDGVPYIGRYTPAKPDWYVATGFNKWGMTSSMVAAMLLKELILRGRADWGAVFDPARSMPLLPLAENVLTSAGHLLTPGLRRCSHLGCALKWNRLEHSWDCPCHGSRFETAGVLLNGPANRDLKPR